MAILKDFKDAVIADKKREEHVSFYYYEFDSSLTQQNWLYLKDLKGDFIIKLYCDGFLIPAKYKALKHVVYSNSLQSAWIATTVNCVYIRLKNGSNDGDRS